MLEPTPDDLVNFFDDLAHSDTLVPYSAPEETTVRIYLEPVNLRQWNLFDNVKGSGHVEWFRATRDMQLGDIVILHVGKQDPAHESGVYAYGTVIYGPYILENRSAEYCNNKLTVDVRIDHIVYDTPIITHE